MKDHIHAMCRSCYCHIRNIGKVRSDLTKDAAITLIHAFVASNLDHMNAFLYELPKYLLYKWQKIQNNRARIVCRPKHREHITPVPKNLHWLPIDFRIELKKLLTTFKVLIGVAPGYICDMLHPYQPARALWSMNVALLRRPSSKRNTDGEKSFAAAAPKLWNKPPLSLRQATEVEWFKSVLKTHVFKKGHSVWTIWLDCDIRVAR